MLGERSDQRGLWEADRLYLDHLGKDTFYGLLASLRGRLFRDAEFYCLDNGRDSVREVFESSLRLARESGYLKRLSGQISRDCGRPVSRAHITVAVGQSPATKNVNVQEL